MTGSPATAAIAEFATAPVAVPPEVAAAAAALLTDVTTRAATGAADPDVTLVASTLTGSGATRGESDDGRTGIGTSGAGWDRPFGRFGPEWEATLTAMAAAPDGAELGIVVAAAALAVAPTTSETTSETTSKAGGGAGGGVVDVAVAVGVQVAGRLVEVLGDRLGRRGFDVVACCGCVGAVVAAGRVVGLDAAGMSNAIGVVATQAAGLVSAAGSTAGRLQGGKAAGNAVQAALLARDGFTASPAGLEGRRGFAALLAPGTDLDGVFGDLGRRWLPAPAGRVA